MGLKKTNYFSEKFQIPIPEAYAIIKEMRIRGDVCKATFAIQSTRENALKAEPFEIKELTFTVDRNESPYVTAYKIAKTPKYSEMQDPETGNIITIMVNSPLFLDWEDDIVLE